MKHGLISLIVALSFIVASATLATDAGQESPFSLGAGARSLGMGGGMTALPFDASAVFYNPAGLPWLEYQEVSFMHMSLFEGTLYDVATWGSPVTGIGGFGAGFMRIGTNDIVRRTDFVDQGKFDYASWQFLLAYGRRIGDRISAGLSFKVVNSSIDNLSDYGLGLDFGVRAVVRKNIALGLMIRDILPPQLTIDSSSEQTPVTAVAGIALNKLQVANNVVLSAALDIEKSEFRDPKIHTGAEVLFFDRYALRGGYDRDNFSLGAGISYGRLRIDYAYKFLDYIEDSHRFSVSFLIGPSVTEQQRRRQAAEAERGSVMLRGERDRQFQAYKQKADTFYQKLDLDSALTYYQRALAFDEHNETILGTIAAIQNVQRIQRQQEQNIQQSQKEQTQFVNTYFDQASAFYAKKYYPAALDLVNLVLDIRPSEERAQLLKADIQNAMTAEITEARRAAAQAEQDRHAISAIEAYNRILELDPNDAAAKQAKQRLVAGLDVTQQLSLGIDLFNSGRLDEAKRQFDAVIKISPQDPVALEYLAKLGAVNPVSPTLEDLQKDKEVWPLYLEGLRFMRNKEYDKAIVSWEKVLKSYPNNANTIENIKQARLRLQSQ